MAQKIIQLGGTDPERLYLHDQEWDTPDGDRVVVKRTLISDDPRNIKLLDDMIARHIGRYSVVGLFCRPGFRVLDFPCGSGYAAEVLKTFGVDYQGLEFDPLTVEYARRMYATTGSFDRGDLTRPDLAPQSYDVIACIEGLEHIGQQYQSPLIAAFKRALKPGGVLVVSSPENPTGVSGPSLTNSDHAWELTKGDFLALLHQHFPADRVEIITHKAVLDPGGLMTCLYAICHA